MSVTPTPIYPQSLISVPTQLTSSTSTSTPTQILASQTNGAKVEAIMVTSTDTTARDLNVYIQVSGTSYLIGCISIPITAGSVDTVSSVNLLTALSTGAKSIPLPTDANGNPYLYLSPGSSLYVEPPVALTSGKVINIVVLGGAF